jgi:hypothetical protein
MLQASPPPSWLSCEVPRVSDKLAVGVRDIGVLGSLLTSGTKLKLSFCTQTSN